MSGNIEELFGLSPRDNSPTAKRLRRTMECPFLGERCTKNLRDGAPSGGCSIKPVTSAPVIVCPIRLYANDYRILQEVSDSVFGKGMSLRSAVPASGHAKTGKSVAVFGRGWGGELRLPARGGHGGYFIDWILAKLDHNGSLNDFVAVEVQSIDTTGSYRTERDTYLRGNTFSGVSSVGLNWENVYKRILPQLIYKGHVLRREPKCTKGLYFVCPEQVYKKIEERAGGTGSWLAYPPGPGTITFRYYNLGPPSPAGTIRTLSFSGEFTTTIDQLANALAAPTNLPPAQVYEEAIRHALA